MGNRDADLASLRRILLGPDHHRLATLRARLEDPLSRAEDIGEVLPQVLQKHAHDPQLARALTPPLEQAITASVQRNPKPLADALFPVMGPAIRKAVSAGLASMVESLNRTLEHSLSLQSIQWRLEALRTGKSFGEVVLLKTLVFRVEQVFLIDRQTGLLLQHVRAGTAGVQDANMVSGMLTAIRDFVQDSFRVSANDSLDAFAVGDLSVWIAAGPHALLATVIRGSAPRDFRRVLEEAIETIHLQFGHALETFNGDASTLDHARPTLEACLHTEYRASERKPRTRGAWIVFASVAVALVVWFGLSYRANTRWARYLDLVRAEPGLVVVSAERRGGKFVVSGLRDPLARDPQTLVASTGLAEGDVAGTWAPYQALDPSLVRDRAARALPPPNGASLTLKDGVLSIDGAAPLAWILDAQRVAPLIAGVTRFDAGGAFDAVSRAIIARLHATTVLFPKGGAQPIDGQDDQLRRFAADVRELESLAAASGHHFTVEAVGHTDQDGPPDLNVPLSHDRGASLLATVAAASLPHLRLTATGVGSDDPAVRGVTEADNQKNRRVTVRVTRGDDKQ